MIKTPFLEVLAKVLVCAIVHTCYALARAWGHCSALQGYCRAPGGCLFLGVQRLHGHPAQGARTNPMIQNGGVRRQVLHVEFPGKRLRVKHLVPRRLCFRNRLQLAQACSL